MEVQTPFVKGPDRVQANAALAGTGLTLALKWAWDGFVPTYPMPAEVAVTLVPVIGHVIAWLAGWVPKP